MVPIQIVTLSLVLILAQPWLVGAELFTAISDVEYLLETHKKILDDLEVYVGKEERRLRSLKIHLNRYKREHDRAMEDIPNYLGNPINAFTLIKRLTTDLDSIEQGIKIGTEYIKNITMSHPDVKYPTNEDLIGAAQALTRLQETYSLDVGDLSEGKLNGVSYSTPMSASDCYQLGRALYDQRDFRNALAWMMEALRKYDDDEEIDEQDFSKVDVLEHIGFSHYLMGDVKTALAWTKQLLELEPNHERAANNVPHYEKSILELKDTLKKKQRGDIGEEVQSAEKEKIMTDYKKERLAYEKLCRGEIEVPSKVTKKLKCRYMSETHPFLRLAPFKVEQMYSDPDIFIFHEVISDEEIEVIKDLARPRFKRAVVHDPSTGELVAAPYRISKSGWLKDEEADVVARLTRRTADITGLDMGSAEELQVVNYGIGGHYEPHYDFARKRESAFTNFPGNRIATVLYYLSQVSQGGATVFPLLGVSLQPQPRAAAVWLNLHPSGEGDLATRHAACPVLRGDKWVCNKWIHQGGQELIKPCSTIYEQEHFMRSLPKPVPKTSR